MKHYSETSKVKTLFTEQSSLQATEAGIIKKTHCLVIKFPRIPAPLKHLSLQSLIAKKWTKMQFTLISPLSLSKEALHTHQCCCNQKDIIVFAKKEALTPGRVKRWKFKEYLLAARKLRGMRDVAAPSKKHQVTLLETGKSSEPSTDYSIPERQFSVRIAKPE